MKRIIALMAVLFLPGCGERETADRGPVEHLTSPAIESLDLPFSEAVRVGDTLYLSGMVGVVPGKLELVPGGFEAEARQTLTNIQTMLETHGFSKNDVVKCTVMLADISEWPAFNEIYASFFEEPFPARSAFGANGLALGARLEVECLARR